MVRQAHPGPGVEAYHSFEEKLEDARNYTSEEQIPWPVLVDDLEGTVHQVYGMLADPTYLLDVEGRVSYYNMWTHAPNLHNALATLIEQGGRGVVGGGIDHVVHMLPALTHGWKGIRRGYPQSFIDLETAMPGMGSGLWLGHTCSRILEPVTLRSKPFAFPVKSVAAVVVGVVGVRLVRRQMRQ
jgi:hypothetical protein